MASTSSAPAPAPGSIVKRVTSTVASSSRKAFDLISPPPIRKEDLRAGDHIYSWRAAYSYAHHGIYIGEGKVIHFTRGEGEELGIGGGTLAILDGILVASSAWGPAQGKDGGQCPRCGSSKDSHGVVLSCLDCFLRGGAQALHRFEYGEKLASFLARPRGGTCTLAPADAPHLVLHRASYLLRFGGFGCYDLFRNNCEDFAMYCKTGRVVVPQTASASAPAFWPTASAVVGTSGQAASAVGAPLAALASSPVLALLSTAAEPWGFAVAAAGLYCAGRYAADLANRPDAARIPVEDLVARLRSPPPATTQTQRLLQIKPPPPSATHAHR